MREIVLTMVKINWKTTGAAIGMLLTALAPVVTALTDGDPSTHANWEIAVPAVMAAIGLLFAKDGVSLVSKK